MSEVTSLAVIALFSIVGWEVIWSGTHGLLRWVLPG